MSFLESKFANPLVILLLLAGSMFIFHRWFQFVPIEILKVFRPIAFAGPIVIFLWIYKHIPLQSRFLSFLGNYSYEIFLLHVPFMAKYDFFLFRKPFIVYFFVYLAFLMVTGFLLGKMSDRISDRIFGSTGAPG